jgi:hypothetical protein
MLVDRESILTAALRLSESDRWAIIDGLSGSLTEAPPGLDANSPDFLEELERRMETPGETIAWERLSAELGQP